MMLMLLVVVVVMILGGSVLAITMARAGRRVLLSETILQCCPRACRWMTGAALLAGRSLMLALAMHEHGTGSRVMCWA